MSLPTPRICFIAALLALGSLVAVSGCAPYNQTNRYTIQQAALVPPPTGPSASGPMEKAGDVALEGALTASESRSAGNREDGALGHIVLDRNLGLRILGGANDILEVSGGVTFSNAELSSSAANDLKQDAFGSTTVAWYEPEMRLRFVESADADVYAVIGARAAVLPYVRHVHTATSTSFDHSAHPNIDDHTDHSSNAELEQKNKLVVLPRGGIGSYFKLSKSAGVTVGGLLQGAPRFFGQKQTVTYCENATGQWGDERCSGTEPDEIDPMEMALIGTVYGGFHVAVDRTTLGLQGFYNVGGDAQWKESSPFGATMTIRQSF